ncbi:MAG: 4-hydroxythreonine-4-phosphate dehydrogenase PdxA [Armatimonadota bacterium]|nr:4-hydroxythreonine-4-phosphate dehydrogenase PdxA [bacterium]
MNKRSVIGITLGDPAGIGPEITLGALESKEVYERCVPVVIGHAGLLRRCAQIIGKTTHIETIDSPGQASGAFGTINVIHVETPGMQDIQPGALSADAGMAANAFVKKACELGLSGEIDAIATTPINKESLRLAGIEHIGHTEMLAAYLGSPNPLTLFITENMRIFFLSRHLSLKQAIDYINVERVYEFIRRVHLAMTDFGFADPSIGMAALNPHASDGGQFGDEEERFLIPAVRMAREEGIRVSEPVGADSVFNMALEGKFDCVISLYHDQGHIAAKTRDFYGTVTATLRLPVLRTSVDHGTALDIAWKGIANPVSMKAAILAAVDMLEKRASGI